MRVPNDAEHRIICINPTKRQLEEAYKTILRKQGKYIANNTPLFVFVYFGGHGVSHKSQQVCCLNSSIANDALFYIEYKLRYLYSNPLSTVRVFAIFDCCNTSIMNHKGLYLAVQGKGEDGILADPKDNKKIKPCKYLHLSPARPDGIAAANAKNA